MKKKHLLLGAIIATSSLFTLISCGNKQTVTTASSSASRQPVESSTTTTIPTSRLPQYNLEDNEISLKVFNEYKKTFSNITYDDFRINGRRYVLNNEIEYDYNSSYIKLNLDYTFKVKEIRLKDTNGNFISEVMSNYINNEWIRVSEFKYYNGEKLRTYELVLNNDGSINHETINNYDENGNRLSYTWTAFVNNSYSSKDESILSEGKNLYRTYYKYIDGEWVKTKKEIYINDEKYDLYLINFDRDGNFQNRYEYTYDDQGNKLSEIYSKFNGTLWEYLEKKEYSYELDTNRVTTISYEYANNDWYYYSKTIETFDSNRNSILAIVLKYENNEWVNDYKLEHTYDNLNELSEIVSKYVNGEWVYQEKEENTYDQNDNVLCYSYSIYDGNNWVYRYKYEYTYDENDSRLTKVYSDYTKKGWKIIKEYIYTKLYYNNNHEDQLVCMYHIDDEGEYTEKFIYTYDEAGEIASVETYKYVNGEWVLKQD